MNQKSTFLRQIFDFTLVHISSQLCIQTRCFIVNQISITTKNLNSTSLLTKITFELQHNNQRLNLQQDCYTCKCPLGSFFLCFQIKSPHKSRSSRSSLVNRTVIHISQVLFILRYSFNEDDRHYRE